MAAPAASDRVWGLRGSQAAATLSRVDPAMLRPVGQDGERAWLADGDGEICEVELDSLAVVCRSLRAPAAVMKSGSPWSRRQLKLVAGAYLYVPRTDGRTVVAELATGRVLRRVVGGVQPFQDADTW